MTLLSCLKILIQVTRSEMIPKEWKFIMAFCRKKRKWQHFVPTRATCLTLSNGENGKSLKQTRVPLAKESLLAINGKGFSYIYSYGKIDYTKTINSENINFHWKHPVQTLRKCFTSVWKGWLYKLPLNKSMNYSFWVNHTNFQLF